MHVYIRRKNERTDYKHDYKMKVKPNEDEYKGIAKCN